MLDVLDLPDHCDAVAHLKTKVRACDKIDACAVHTCDIELIRGMQAEGAELHTVIFGLGDKNAARHNRPFVHWPLFVDFWSDKSGEYLFVLKGTDCEDNIAEFDAVFRGGYDYSAVRFLDS